MKILKMASLIVGILLMILAGIGFVVSLLLPAMTDNHVSFEESMYVLIPSAIVFIFAFLLTVISAFFVLKRKKTVV
jgi:uncharacterized membrane protein